MPLAAAPVDVQVLDEEAGGDQPRAVVHPARRAELAHAGVDDRIARAALAPGVEVLVVAVPVDRVELAAVGVVGVARVVQEHVGVEVAPRELARVRVVAAGLLLELARETAPKCRYGESIEVPPAMRSCLSA